MKHFNIYYLITVILLIMAYIWGGFVVWEPIKDPGFRFIYDEKTKTLWPKTISNELSPPIKEVQWSENLDSDEPQPIEEYIIEYVFDAEITWIILDGKRINLAEWMRIVCKCPKYMTTKEIPEWWTDGKLSIKEDPVKGVPNESND